MATSDERVLCVDLDGTLLATDLLWESLLSATRRDVSTLVFAPVWLMRGRATLKRRLADLAELDYARLPYRAETLSFVIGERDRGRCVVLATASDRRLAMGVANHLQIFSDVLASDGVVNLKGQAKAAELISRYGAGNYDYIGDSRADIASWTSAADAITVGVSPTHKVKHLRQLTPLIAQPLTQQLRTLLRALRPHQWLKNLLLFVPLLGAHRLDWPTISAAVTAFASLSLCASGGYALNDLLDLGADRRHPRKKSRPFAAGRLSIRTGVLMLASLWVAGFMLARTLPWQFSALIAAYLVSTAAYSIRLKREPVLDVLFLAGLYVLRVVGGGWSTGVAVSTWLLAFTLFICLSLAYLKRFIEVRAQQVGSSAVVPGRGYVPDDASWLQSAGLASAYSSVLVLALYVNNPDVMRLYTRPDRLLLICPLLLYGATKVWLSAQRSEIHDDPLVAVVADPASYILLALIAAVVVSAV